MSLCSNTYNVLRIAMVLEASRSGFYYWIKHRHKVTQREAIHQKLDKKFKIAFDNSKGRGGSMRIHKELADSGEIRNAKTLPPVWSVRN